MRTQALLACLLLLLGTGAVAQSYQMTIHLAGGQTVTIPHDAIARLTIVDDASGADGQDGDGPARPAFSVLRAYPNPFNPATTIEYELPAAAAVTVRVFDLHGALVRELQRETLAAGLHRVVWNGTDGDGAPVASGVYLGAVACGDEILSRQLILVK